MNPMYTIAQTNGIETVKTWNDEKKASYNYYWFKGAKEELDIEMVENLSGEIEDFIGS